MVEYIILSVSVFLYLDISECIHRLKPEQHDPHFADVYSCNFV